ncbi:hypothetical protein ACFPRL_32655 [Pseudoclavibacter helvolus]
MCPPVRRWPAWSRSGAGECAAVRHPIPHPRGRFPPRCGTGCGRALRGARRPAQ